MRALAQSLAREFGPQGVHVSHVIIDGVIDIPRTKEWKFEHEDAKLDPDAVSFLFLILFSWLLFMLMMCRLPIRTGICIRSHGQRLGLSWICGRMLRGGRCIRFYNAINLGSSCSYITEENVSMLNMSRSRNT